MEVNIAKTFGLILLINLKRHEGLNSIRKLVPKTLLTERELEIGASYLLDKEYIIINDAFVSANSEVTVTDAGESKINNLLETHLHIDNVLKSLKKEIYKYNELEKKQNSIDKNEMKASHNWVKITSFGNPKDASAILKSKMYPMGGRCKKCGITSKEFNKNPKYCISTAT